MIGEFDGKYKFNGKNNLAQKREMDLSQERINALLSRFNEKQEKPILALRAIASQFIPHCFSKVYSKDFGYDPKTGEVIP
ncbi:MAG: hypothetical protein LBI69_00085 [Puniceicoccales bacterium]|jgi:hypothetical protein|nr:hypothetical protein [Puniceicoccales bacterium]